jgi:hypothetical protein
VGVEITIRACVENDPILVAFPTLIAFFQPIADFGDIGLVIAKVEPMLVDAEERIVPKPPFEAADI